MADAGTSTRSPTLLEAGDGYGAGRRGGEHVNVEFVSANPTGPITIASGAPRRLRRLARAHPRARRPPGRARVLRERRRQPGASASASRSGRARAARSRRRTATAATTWASSRQRIDGAADADPDELARRGIELMLEGVRATLARFRVHMDQFFSERTLHEGGEVEAAIERLGGDVYEHDGALWLRTTAYGDDKDRVLRRSNGECTYFASDIAYHVAQARPRLRPRDQRAGAPTTTATSARMRIALGGARRRSGAPRDHHHAARQPHRGRRARDRCRSARARSSRSTTCSTTSASTPRAGSSLQRSHDTTLDLDLELARERVAGQPGLLRAVRARADRVDPAQGGRGARAAGARAPTCARAREQLHPSARALVKRLLELPGEIREAAASGARRTGSPPTRPRPPQDFSAFYRDCRVVGAAEEGGDEDVRIALARAHAARARAVARPARRRGAGADVGAGYADGLELAEEVQAEVVHRASASEFSRVSSFV